MNQQTFQEELNIPMSILQPDHPFIEMEKIARRQFLSQESSLQTNKDQMEKYIQFMRYHITNKNITLVNATNKGYYIPHHQFCNSGNIRSLIENPCPICLENNPNKQKTNPVKCGNEQALIPISFRQYPIAIAATISSIYGQFENFQENNKSQNLFWRESPSEPLLTYTISPVSYAPTAIPNCAVIALQECAKENEREFPIGSRQILKHLNMNNYHNSADNSEDAKIIFSELGMLLSKGGFKISSWYSNHGKYFQFNINHHGDGMPFPNLSTTSIIQLRWMPETDNFKFHIVPPVTGACWTPNEIIPITKQLIDPNGFIAPIIMPAKILARRIQQINGDADYPISQNLCEEWNTILTNLSNINHISIPRWLNLYPSSERTLIGFCTASTRAYSAVVYLRTTCTHLQNNDRFSTNLIRSKTKIAPMNTQHSISTLGLLSAELLVDLMNEIKNSFEKGVDDCLYLSDLNSTVSWVTNEPKRLMGLVANRVRIIRQKSISIKWLYTPSDSNPAKR